MSSRLYRIYCPVCTTQIDKRQADGWLPVQWCHRETGLSVEALVCSAHCRWHWQREHAKRDCLAKLTHLMSGPQLDHYHRQVEEVPEWQDGHWKEKLEVAAESQRTVSSHVEWFCVCGGRLATDWNHTTRESCRHCGTQWEINLAACGIERLNIARGPLVKATDGKYTVSRKR